jgi:tRNA G18 (ribose-2'-O)-methylase SpoU
LSDFSKKFSGNIAIVFWNEVEWVLPQTLKLVEEVVYIPMQWVKESMNIGQSTAIFMLELRNK